MKDLQILEEQQRESQQKLHYAQTCKERTQQKHDKMESELGELKYANGQSRGVQMRMEKVVKESQREVTIMRNELKKADGGLEDFNKYVQ